MSEKIIPSYKKTLKSQDYSKKPSIEGVKVIELKNFISEDGFLSEVGRFDDEGNLESFPGFKLRQVNFTKVLPGTIKAWHLHEKQDDVWYIPPDGLLSVGLVDLRKDSPTKEINMKLVMGGGRSQLLFIPAGVAHGYANFTTDSLYVFYLVNLQFNPDNSDEGRLPWDLLGEDFWKVAHG